MNRNVKLILMFLPLALFFAGLMLVIDDMRHPTLTRDNCKVTAVGKDVGALRTPDNVLYQQSSNPLNDVAFQCARFGEAVLNDIQLFQYAIERGQSSTIVKKEYRYLPVMWSVDVNTGKPKDS